jgi:hypothetical protein
MPALYPDINGVRWDYSCVEVRIGVTPFRGVKSINYADGKEPGDVFGTGAQRVGRTRGQYKPEGSIELYEQEWRDLLAALPPMVGYLEAIFPIIITYQSTMISALKVDVLYGCQIKKVSSDRQEGSDAITVKLDLDIMRIERDGRQALTQMLL